MNYAEALEYLDSFTNYENELTAPYPEAFKLDRMRALAKALGNPQNAYDSILIAGSKGKGSTAVFTSSILRMENLKVGLYTSPHLEDLKERIRVNGLKISETRFVEIVLRLRRELDDATWRKDPPTYFELLTALAFLHFKEMKVQVAVLEVGLGGLYDSTNIAEAKVAGLTPISLEHTDKLGKTVSKIAVQKCGIIKGRESVVSASQTQEAEKVIEETAEEREADLMRLGREIKILHRNFGENFQRFAVYVPWGHCYDLEIQLLGEHQIENAAVAVGLAKALGQKTRLKISDDAVKQGLKDAIWPGRLEKISDTPRIVVDGAHNPDSIRKMLLGLRRHFHFANLIVVLGLSADKDVKGILEPLFAEVGQVIVTESKNPRAMPVRNLVAAAQELGKEALAVEEAADAVKKAISLAAPEDLIVVTGSLYLIGELKHAGF